ncbi:hypothetical protein TWF506_006120 [Arthrobotrys conoides]|uniref:Uncharacterized protein n=1 Tax=Arthrobotrys conoides TaxID=74498 RepID=A0AAN8S0A5_9PEZI
MPIKPYLQSPPLRPTVNTHGLPTRRISALIIEEDLSDIDTPDSSWFLPANVYETITITQKEVPEDLENEHSALTIAPIHLDIPTAADTSRRPSICLARLQTQGVEDADIRLPNYEYAHSMNTASRRGSTSSEVFFHSPLRRTRTYENYSSSGSSSASGSSAASGYESPVFYPDSDCGCDDCDCDHEEAGVSKMAKSLPIQVPVAKGNATTTRRRRGCFVQNDMRKKVDEDEIMEDSDDEEAIDEGSIEDWVQFAYTPSSTFETALISEVVRRRKSDERFATIKNYGIGYEKELENAQFSESHRRSQWMRDMVRWYPQECGGGHVLPCIS